MDAERRNIDIGRRAREIREARGLSQAAAAELTEEAGFKMSQVNLLQLEKGRVRWNVWHITTMARVYGVDPVALWIDVEEQSLLKAWRTGRVPGVMTWLAQRLDPPK